MKPNKIHLIYYSPTGTSKKVLEDISKGFDMKTVERIDLTPKEDASNKTISANDLAIIGVPTYGGRVPIVAAQRLKAVKGNDTPAVIVVLYGNRAFEDSMIELRDIVSGQGFKTIAGAAFIGEHSFSSKTTPIAVGRPDAEDLAKARTFGEQVRAKIDAMTKPVEISVPGNKPYKERNPASPRAPETTAEICTLCGACAKVCPTKSITVTDKVETAASTCTACSACVKVCPTGARVWKNEGIFKAATWLNREYSKRREPEFFL